MSSIRVMFIVLNYLFRAAAKFATKEDINSSQATLSSSYNQEELDEM